MGTLQSLYEADVLTGDGILAWGASTASPLKDSAQIKALLEGRKILPNEWHASDHLPVSAVLEFVEPSLQ